MVQYDVPKNRTSSGKINPKWYLERLKSTSTNSYLKRRNSNSTIRVVRGTTATQGQFISKFHLQSPQKQQSQLQQEKSFDLDRLNSFDIRSATSFKSISTKHRTNSSKSEFTNRNFEGKKYLSKDDKDKISVRRSSSTTNQSERPEVLVRPPSTPVDRRCQRDYSSRRNSIQKETCHLLGPQLCSDCIEIQTRSNLSSENLPMNLIQQRLSALAIRSFIPNEKYLTDDHLYQMINHQQIQIHSKESNQLTNSILSDQEYFDDLSSTLSRCSNQTPFFFQNLKHLSDKYSRNEHPRLLLSENPPPTSSNPLFQQSSFEKFDVSSKYSMMKRASTRKPNLKWNSFAFISPRKSEQFFNQHRFLINYSPPLLHQSLQKTSRDFSSFNLQNKTTKQSLINSKKIIFH